MFSVLHCLFMYGFLAFSLSNVKSPERSNSGTLPPQTRMDIEFYKVTSQKQFWNNTAFLEQTTAQRRLPAYSHINCAMMYTAFNVNHHNTRKTTA